MLLLNMYVYMLLYEVGFYMMDEMYCFEHTKISG